MDYPLYMYFRNYQELPVNTNPAVNPRSHKSGSGQFVLLWTEMAELMKRAYESYRYIFIECAGKKPHLDIGYVICKLT